MQQFFLVFVLFLDCQLIFARENPLYHSINTSSPSTVNDFDQPQIRAALNSFIKWFTPILAIFSLFIALVCPFFLWISQERCLYSSSNRRKYPSTTLITKPRLLLTDPRTKSPKSHSSSTNQTPFYSLDSSKQQDSYYTPRVSVSSIDTMV